jgi:hypothetical protein
MPKGTRALILGLLAADALGTQVAVRLGISSNHEGAGNHVARLNAEGVCRELESAGFRVCARRYLMYYKHEPGRVMRLLSRPGGPPRVPMGGATGERCSRAVGEQAPGDRGTSRSIRPPGLWSGRLGWSVVQYGLLFEGAWWPTWQGTHREPGLRDLRPVVGRSTAGG